MLVCVLGCVHAWVRVCKGACACAFARVCTSICAHLRLSSTAQYAPRPHHARPAAGGEELDVDLLRMTVVRETWQGILDDPLEDRQQLQGFERAAARAPEETSCLDGKRLTPRRMGGEWKVFELCAQPVVEKDVLTGVQPAVRCRAVGGLLGTDWTGLLEEMKGLRVQVHVGWGAQVWMHLQGVCLPVQACMLGHWWCLSHCD